jgi:hypothetical protein
MEIVLIIVCFGLAVVSVIIHTIRQERKRCGELSGIAVSMKLRYVPAGDQTLLNDLSCFQLFSSGQDQRMSNLLHGRVGDIDVHVFDYRYNSGGSSPTTYRHAVAFVRSPQSLPGFRLQPTNIVHKIGNLFGYTDINFVSHPKFSKQYHLKGDDEVAIRKIFNPSVLSFCETQQKLNAEGKSDKLIVYRYGQLKPKEVQDLVRTVIQISELMRA